MDRILDFIAKETDGKNYKSYKYCFESVDIPKLDYEDKKGIQVKKKGETDKSLIKPKSVKSLADKISKKGTPLFKYFLDGSRRTYKVDDIAYGKRLYPIIAGQIGVAVCERTDKHSLKPISLKNPLVISIPENANAQTTMGNNDLFFNNLIKKLNEQEILEKQQLKFSKILPYKNTALKENDKYEDRGVAKIQDEMIALEQRLVFELVRAKKLSEESFLIKEEKKRYTEMLGLSTEPFKNVKYYYPYSAQSSSKAHSYAQNSDIDAQIDSNKGFKYKYVFEDDKLNLDLLFSSIEDSSGTMESIINFIITDQGGFGEITSWAQFISKISEFTQAGRTKGDKEISKGDYRFVPSVYKNMMTRLDPGEYIIEHPVFRSLLNIKFPRPLYKQFPNG